MAALRDPIDTEMSGRIALAEAIEIPRVIKECAKELSKSANAASVPSLPPTNNRCFAVQCLMD